MVGKRSKRRIFITLLTNEGRTSYPGARHKTALVPDHSFLIGPSDCVADSGSTHRNELGRKAWRDLDNGEAHGLP